MGSIPSVTEAQAILEEFTQSPNLRKHGAAVGAAMRAYAEKYNRRSPEALAKGEVDPDRWEAVGLLHDFDYEQYPSLEEHPFKGAEILRARGVDDEFIKDIFAHAPHTGQPRDTLLRKAVFACDELAGFIVAVALVQPNRKLSEVTAESVLKKLKQRGFAAKVSREDIEKGASELGIPLAEHVAIVLSGLQRSAAALGL